ncbi:hypothetical protein QBC39DRAFT_50195 [Podospora conica]|nr:hypothetical protein QBC39DRAFT_50195 [Schizothecium conicum]
MFDVHWDDEALESVGHKKTRGPAKKDRKKDNESRNMRSSISSRSSLSSGDNLKSSSFFGSLGLKMSNSRRGSSKLSPPTVGTNSRTTSLRSQPGVPLPSISIAHTIVCPIPTDTSIHIGLTPTSCDFDHTAVPSAPPSLVPSEGNSTKRSSKDTTLSESTEATAPASPPPAPFRPAVADAVKKGPQSVDDIPAHTPRITVTTEVVSAFEGIGGEHGDPVVSKPLAGQNPPTSTGSSSGTASTSTVIHNWFEAVHEPNELPSSSSPRDSKRFRAIPLPNLKPPTTKSSIPRPDSTPPTKRKQKADRRKSAGTPKASNPDAWKSPKEWESKSPSKLPTPVLSNSNADKVDEQNSPDSLALDLAGMKREVARMTAASAHLAIARMNEDWGASDHGSFYKEVEMERKRWMLSALDRINKLARNAEMGGEANPRDEPTTDQLLLLLFETQATASYLAAVHDTATVTHFAPQPLSGLLFPNVSPLQAPITASLPLPRNWYNGARCLSLPSLLPSSDIPTLLGGIHRCLAPKGVLHLVLIDPLPTRESLGPCMRHWLDDNLLINLEAQFRCTSPNRVFPLWLAKAGLRGDGSVITKVKFNAVHQADHGEGKGKTGEENGIEDELRTTMGRNLWKEVWGNFALGKVWWWDDAACVEECARLGTHFEYSVIEAVKEEAA